MHSWPKLALKMARSRCVANFSDLLQRARGTQSSEFLCMRAQFLLCQSKHKQRFHVLFFDIMFCLNFHTFSRCNCL